MKFNIIFTTNTVKYLWPFTRSILNHTRHDVRVISNYCTDEEIQFLKDVTHDNPRIELHVSEVKAVVPHHWILNEIYPFDTESEFFCIMDSDIFATGDFMTDFSKALESKSALFSCKPILESPLTPEKGINRLQGRHFHDRNGNLVGGSYFAIYRRAALDDIMNRTELKFDRIGWKNIPGKLRSQLKLKDMRYERYDTAKLLNIFLSHHGHEMVYIEHPMLHHIGGISWSKSKIEKDGKAFNLRSPPGLLGDIVQRRRRIAKYFSDLIEAINLGNVHPHILDLENETENYKVKKMTEDLCKIYVNNNNFI